MPQILQFIFALVVIIALALLVSNDRKKIRLRYIIQLLVIEGALAYFFLHSESGLSVIKHVAGFFETLLTYAAQGSDFVFGGMPDYLYFRADRYFAAFPHSAADYPSGRHPAVQG